MRTPRWTRRRTAAALSLATLLALLVLTRPLLSFAITLSRSTAAFVPTTDDARVLFEPGAEAEAALVASALPSAIATVERALGGPFARPIAVHVCATPETFARFTGGDRAAGTTLGARLFLAPKLGRTPERVPGVLAHELSHLYFQQREGVYAFHRGFPPWLAEGIGVWASGGGGAEGVSDAEAAQAILEGRAFVPTVPGFFSSRPAASAYGLDAHLFYRESGLFVAYLHARDPGAFHRMVEALERGEPLARAFPAAYGVEVDAAWRDFVRGLRARR
jgi:hypothetical protein